MTDARHLVVLVAGILLATTALAGCAESGPDVEDPDEPMPTVELFLAEDDGDGVLAREPGTSDSGSVSADPAAGPAGYAQETAHRIARIDGGDPVATFTFRSAPLEETYHLRADRHLNGTLYWRQDPEGVTGEYAAFARVELSAGGEFLGARWLRLDEAGALDAWNEEQLRIMAERSTLEAGEQLTYKIQIHGSVGPFEVGLDGDHQSVLRFTYHPNWSPTSYVNTTSGELTFVDDDGSGDGNASTASSNNGIRAASARARSGVMHGLVAGGALALLAFAVVAWRRRDARGRTPLGVLVVVLMVAPALAGCLGAAPGDGGGAGNGAGPGGTTDGVGTVEGTVYSSGGVPLEDVHVTVLDHSNFTRTDAEGRFTLHEVPAGEQTLRADRGGYVSQETTITITPDNTTRVEIVMPTEGQSPGSEVHRHDDWGDRQEITVFDGSVQAYADNTFVYDVEQLGEVPAAGCYWGVDYCVFPFRPDQGKTILPGTDRVEVTMSWEDQKLKRAGIAVRPAGDVGPLMFSQKTPGSTWEIPVDPTMSDGGHQPFSFWTFYIYVRGGGDLLRPQDPGQLVTESFDVTASIVKEETLPLEPPHRDFWKGNDTKTVIDSLALEEVGDCAQVGGWYRGPKELPYRGCAWSPAEGNLVPPGTARLTVEMTWHPGQYPYRDSWSLALHPATLHPEIFEMGDLRSVSPDSSCGEACVTFEIPVRPEETDAYYQLSSNWMFFLDDGDSPDSPTGHSLTEVPYADTDNAIAGAFGDPTHHLTVVAHRKTDG